MNRDQVDNPLAAAPPTAAKWPAWVASVTAGVAVIVITSAWVWTAGRLVNCVNRDDCETTATRTVDHYRDQADRVFQNHERRLAEAEAQRRESHGLLVELRTKVDLILQRVKE